jgi:hypothetical protein
MPPVAILAAATIGSAAIGAGANIASAGSNAKAAQSTAAANAAQINATRAYDESLLAQQQSANQRFFDEAKGDANTDIINGTNQGVGAINAGAGAAAGSVSRAHDANAGVFQDAYGRGMDAAGTLQGQGEGLYGATAARGNDAGSAINALLGIGGDSRAQEAAFNNWLGSTGYNFTLKSGADAASSNATTKGLLGSGGTLKALSNFGQQTGQTYFGSYLNGLQNQQATGLTAANALSGVYGNVAGLKTNAANTLAGNLSTNNTNTGNALSQIYGTQGTQLANLYTGQGQGLAGIAQNYATGLQGLQTGLTNGIVSGNVNATGALTANSNNALSQQISSNNSVANAIGGFAGNLASGAGNILGQSSYQAAPNALGKSMTASSYILPAYGGAAA